MNILNRYTLLSLKKNRTRTLVTIIGIILSVSMFTAVTEAAYSGQQYMINGVIASTGRYEAVLEKLSGEKLNALQNEKNIKTVSSMQNIGYAECNSRNTAKPYLFVAGVDSAVLSDVAVNLQSGRMPQTTNEIVIPAHLSNGGVYYSIGETLTLNIGNRYSDGKVLSQNDYLYDGEKLSATHPKTYTVVGICSRPNMEPTWAPGYTAFTLKDSAEQELYTAFVTVRDARLFWNPGGGLEGDFDSYAGVNTDLLMLEWRFTGDSFINVVIALGSILIAIIFVGSVSLIYNSFSISVSERTRQFGILRSVGATKKQLIRSVLFEGFVLCLIGIPFGLFFGCLGLSVTFQCLKPEFATLFNGFADIGEQVSIRLVPNPVALLLAAVIALFTVLVSALIPAKRAIKITPMQALRLSEDISVSSKKVKGSKLVSRLFHFEGMLAQKNFKRNRKKYRTTVISLVLSLTLFISASSLTYFFNKSFAMRTKTDLYDIYATTTVQNSDSEVFKVLKELGQMEGVTKYAVITEDADSTFSYLAQTRLLTDEYKSYYGVENNQIYSELYPDFVFVNDEAFDQLCKKNGFDLNQYYDKSCPRAVLLDSTVEVIGLGSGKTDRVYIHSVNGKRISEELPLKRIITPDKEWVYCGLAEDGKNINFCPKEYCFEDETEEQTIYPIPISDCTKDITVKVGDRLGDEKPFFISNSLCFIYPMSQLPNVMPAEVKNYWQTGYYCVDDHGVMFNKMQNAVKQSGIFVTVQDMAEGSESIRAFIKLLNVFSYGFIVLISLIAAANVFNTISTNISLRRRELAMLKSVGLSQKGLNRMMRFESLLYGFKSLVIGLPLSLIISVGIYLTVRSSGFEIGFSLPWGSIALGIVIVLAVVVAGMAYSVQKLKKYNTADELKNENL